MTKTFTHRFVTVTETQAVGQKTRFTYRSFEDRRDARDLAAKINRQMGKRAYVVDTRLDKHVILP